MFCKKCNLPLPDDSLFCQYCGEKIQTEPSDFDDLAADDFKDNCEFSAEKVLEAILKFQATATVGAMEKNSQNQQIEESSLDFGLVPENPIYTHGLLSVAGEKEYLNSLRTTNGEKIKYNRQGSVSVNGINGIIDVYETFLPSGQPYKTIYINMYGAEKSQKAPVGFVFDDEVTGSPSRAELCKRECVNTRTVKVKVKKQNTTRTVVEDNSTILHKDPQNTRFCHKCGSIIDSTSKKCTGCGKQYFRANKFWVFLFSAILVISLLVVGGYFVFTEMIAEIKESQAMEAIMQQNYSLVFEIISELENKPKNQKDVRDALFLAGREHYDKYQYDISNEIFIFLDQYEDCSEYINYTMVFTDSEKVTIRDLKNNPTKYDGKIIRLEAVVWTVGDFFYVVDKEYYYMHPNATISRGDFEDSRYLEIVRGYDCLFSPDSILNGDDVIIIGKFWYGGIGEEYMGVKNGKVTTLLRTESDGYLRAIGVYFP